MDVKCCKSCDYKDNSMIDNVYLLMMDTGVYLSTKYLLDATGVEKGIGKVVNDATPLKINAPKKINYMEDGLNYAASSYLYHIYLSDMTKKQLTKMYPGKMIIPMCDIASTLGITFVMYLIDMIRYKGKRKFDLFNTLISIGASNAVYGIVKKYKDDYISIGETVSETSVSKTGLLGRDEITYAPKKRML